MLHKDKRRGDRRWRSHCVWIRRLKNDWATHGWNWNYARYTNNFGLSKEGACSIWAKTTLCSCFFDPGFNGMARFKDTPHPRCSSYECNQRESNHGLESRPIQEWRELARAMGDDVREDWHVRRRDPERLILIRKRCLCGYVMGKEWKKAAEIDWSDYRSEDKCPDCKRKFGEKKMFKMPA